jgi:hypothetical protein
MALMSCCFGIQSNMKQKIGIEKHYLTSAKTRRNVHKVISVIAQKMLEFRNQKFKAIEKFN